MRRVAGWVGAIAVAGAALSGCSQVAQLQPVAGDSISTLRSVTIDSVLDSGAQFKTAPVCTDSGTELTCQGLTSDSRVVLGTGQQLTTPEIPSEFADQVPGWATDSDSFVVAKVTLGQDVIFNGVALAALDDAGRTEQ